jgi:hypothetical protein
MMLFGDPSLRVGGVSRMLKQDFVGTYSMIHDGWKGILELKTASDDYIEQLPNIQGTYTGVDGKNHNVYGYVRTPTYPLPPEWGPDHKIEFSIDFPDTVQKDDDQKFEGYLFTWTKDVIAGTTKWSNIPFGFYANRTSAPHIQTDFNITIGATIYNINVLSNSTIEDFNVSQARKQISFNVTGLAGTCGICNITIPRSLLLGTLSVHRDGSPLTKDVDYMQTENETHNIFYITYTHSTHLIEIRGTEMIPESLSIIIMPLLTLLILAVALLKRKREKQAVIKVK